MKPKRQTWMLIAGALVLVIVGLLVALSPKEEVKLMAASGESSVQPVKLSGANIYLIATESGHILVDAGMPGGEKKLDEMFKELGVDPSSVQLIVVTHGHLDHIGSIAYARQLTGGRVLCHRSLAANLENAKMEPAVLQTKNLGVRLMNYMTRWLRFTGVRPDIVMDDAFDLSEYGIAGKIIHTPGHSASSVSVVLDNGEALIGDMVREQDSGEIGLGAFYEDKQVLLESLEKVAAFEPRTIYLSHGANIDNRALKSVIEANK